MSDDMENSESKSTVSWIWQFIGRLVTAAVVLGITAFFTPGFQISNIWSLVVATIVLTIIDFLIAKFTGLKASPFGKGFVRICIICCYSICNTIFCGRICYIMGRCNNWGINLWYRRLFSTGR